VYEKYDERIPDCPISQMSNAYTKRLAMLCGIEVKREGGDATEALAQYSIWAAAGMERLRTLGIASNLPVRPRKDILPQVGWTVVGHDWRTYITCGDELNEKKWVSSTLLGSSLLIGSNCGHSSFSARLTF